VILQLNPPIPLVSSKGNCTAFFIIDYSTEHSLIFVTFLEDSGECWLFRNSEVRLQKNLTFGRESVSDIVSKKGI